MKKIFLLFFSGCIFLLSATAQTTVVVALDIQKNSTLSIHGTTNVITFKLYQSSYNFIRKNMTITASKNHNKLFLSENKITVPVNRFNSSNKMALRDFFKLMKSDKYPDLNIKLNYIELNSSDSFTEGNAIVDVTITGITKKYTFPIHTQKEGDNYLISIRKDINIRDFQLTPPSQILGMIKVSDWINIDLNLICSIQPVNEVELLSAGL